MHEIDRGGRGDLSVDPFNGAIVRPSALAARTALDLLERIAGWALHPLESAALSRRTPIADLAGRCLERLEETVAAH